MISIHVRKNTLVSQADVSHILSLIELTANSLCALFWRGLTEEAHGRVTQDDCGSGAQDDQKDDQTVADAHRRCLSANNGMQSSGDRSSASTTL